MASQTTISSRYGSFTVSICFLPDTHMFEENTEDDLGRENSLQSNDLGSGR